MILTLRSILPACCLLLAAPAGATSIAAAMPHDPQLACGAVRELVADLNAGKPHGDGAWRLRFYFTDAFGRVEPGELDAFARSLRESAGRPDRTPMRIVALYRLGHKDSTGQYILVTGREQWQLKDYEDNAMLLPVEVDRPHWADTSTTWLITFSGGTITHVREAGELDWRSVPVREVHGCRSG